jgi:large subunit ribosomal protein L35
MPKQKTHKGMSKRFKVTAGGKVKCRTAGRGHILSSKSGKRKRGLRKDTVLNKWEPKMIIEGLRPIL